MWGWSVKVKNVRKRNKNKKGETQTNVIMWLGVIMAVSIVVLWSIKNLSPRHLDLETVNSDLEGVQHHINAACSSSYYKAKFNPITINGKLFINNSQICIENSFNKCRMTLCSVEDNFTIELYNVTYIIIEKNESYNIYSE